MNNNKGLILILSTAIISGFSIFINKYGVSTGNAYIFTFLKNSIVALVLCSSIIMAKDWKKFKFLSRKQWMSLLLVGIFGGGIPFLLFFKGLSLTSPAGSSFVQKTMFIWIFLLASIFLKEKISKNLILAGLVLLTSNLLLLKITLITLDAGIILIFIATLFWSIENIISKHLISSTPPRIVIWARMFIGSLTIFGFIFFTNQTTQLFTVTHTQFGWAMVTSVFLLAYVTTWYNGLKYLNVSTASVILMLGSPITTSLAIFSTGRAITGLEILSMLLAIFGVLIVWKGTNISYVAT